MFSSHLALADRVAIGDRIQAACYVEGLTIRALAEKTGRSIHSVHNWTRGTIPRTPADRAVLAEILHVPEEVLFAEYYAKVEEARSLITAPA